MSKRIIVGITGASGVIYAKRFVELASELPEVELCLIASHSSEDLFRHELPLPDPLESLLDWFDLPPETKSRIRVFSPDDRGAGPASGTWRADGMAIIPCSMKTLAAVAHGYAENLLTRCADVQLKERRPLVLAPRETPLSAIHLENMLKLAQSGAVIIPACPPFYHRPQSIEELVDAVVYKAMAQLGLLHPNAYHWEG